MDEAIAQFVQNWISFARADYEARNARIASLEEQGYRIVEGGQAGPHDTDDPSPWEINDWRTGEMLASGTGTYAEYETAANQLGQTFRIDQVEWAQVEPDGGGLTRYEVEALSKFLSEAPKSLLGRMFDLNPERFD